MKQTLLVSAPYFLPVVERYRRWLEDLGVGVAVAQARERLEEDELLALVGDIDGAICGDDRFTARVLEAAVPRLRVISKWGTGIDSIDRDAAARLGVRVCNTPNAFTFPVADTVFAYILAFARRVPWSTESMRRGGWDKLPSVALNESTLGIVGVGNIGSEVARRARAFGLTLLGHDVKPVSSALIAKTGLTSVSLHTLLERADFVTLNCDLNATSRHLISAAELGRMKPSAVVINTARGPIVDEVALVDALRRGQIAGAALDVFEQEPLPLDSVLRKMPNVLLAAHNSNSSSLAWEAVHRNTLRNALDVLGVQGSDRIPGP
jgi:D-3-phosphoglycerate dehydrogenase